MQNDMRTNIFRQLLLVAMMIILCVGNAQAATYKVSLTVSSGGNGSVFAATTNKKPSSFTSGTALTAEGSSGGNAEFYLWATPNAGYYFSSWTTPAESKGTITIGSSSADTDTATCEYPNSKNYDSRTWGGWSGYTYTNNYTAIANFAAITISDVSPASLHLGTLTSNSSTAKGLSGTLTFTSSHAGGQTTADADFNTPTIPTKPSVGEATIGKWTASGTTITVPVTYKGNGTSWGGTNRTVSFTVRLESKGDTSNGKRATVTASYPNAKITSGSTEKIYATFKTADAPQTGVQEKAVFDVEYVDGTDNFEDPSITGTHKDMFTYNSMSYADGKLTVYYTYNGNKTEGDHTATLTLKVKDAIGGTDPTYGSQSVTLVAHNGPEATNDVSVTTAAGVTTEYATWAEGLAAANANAGSTLTLLKDIDLTDTYGITSTQGITQTFTLDLNGKKLSGAINGSILNPNTKNKTLTIKDSKNGGKIQNITPDFNGVTYGINLSAACTLNLESGTIYVENQKQYSYGTSSVGGTASNATAVEVRAVRLVAGAKFNMSGGKVEAHGTRLVRAIYQESSAANSTEVNITGGEVYAEAPSYVYGILAYGKVNISGTAQINVKINDGLVNGNATYQSSQFNSYTLHRYGYAIYMAAYANTTPSACYFGTLTMTGGTINVENVNKTLNGTSLNTEHTYGIYMGIASAGMGNANGEATDGTNTQKASSIGSIENATINVTHAGVQVYGIDVLGSYNSFNKTTTPFTIKNSTINVTAWQTVYGVLSDVSIDWSNSLTTFTGTGRCSAGNIELTNTTINATTTGGTGAYCAWASATYGTVADAKANTGAQSTGNATYKGEYAVAATLTINSGTYTANAATSSAYAVGSSDRAKTIRNIRGSIISRDVSTDSNGSLGGNAEAYPELYIHGGTFKAKTLSAGTARAVKSGGTTVIDGGTFEADAATSSSVAIAVHSGKTTVSGVTMTAYANTDANAVYVPATVSEYSLFDYAGEVELNNCVATVVTRTAENARGVYVNSTTRTYTLAQFNTAKEANNSTYKTYGDYWQVGTKAISGKATINGGSYTVKSATKNAYGVLLTTNALSTDGTAKADGEIIARNATFNVQTLNGATAYGIQAGGKATVDGCNLTVTASTSDARGVYSLDEKTIVKNSTITTTTSTSGSYGTIGSAVVASNGVERVADFELSGNTISSTAGTETAYAIYMTGVSGGPYATDYFTGSMALAATAVVNSGTYSANASTKTAYAACVADPIVKNEAVATPTLIINDGKFKGTAGAAPFADVSLAGEPGYFVLNGGYYVKDENLDKKLGEGMNKVAVNSGTPEYTEGYRWRVTDNMTGEYVCKIKENGISYASLEEALQVVNADPTKTWTIIMIANYTLSKGDYVLPANTTLLIPYNSTQTKINDTTPAWIDEGNETPYPYCKLTFASGVNMTVSGKIEASSTTYIVSSNLTGIVGGAYGWLQLNEGAHIDLESGADMFAWGYVTGEGTINAKPGSCIYEDFQMGDWRGGNVAFAAQGNTNGINNKGVFLLTHYFVQNVECEVTYRPGSQLIAYTGTYMTFNDTKYHAKSEPIKMVGTSEAMFLMNTATAGADTWVKKKYNTNTDRLEWTLNSGAELGSISMNLTFANLPSYIKVVLRGNTVKVNSADYVLPLTSNFTITANYGEIKLSNDVCFIPGSEVIINKEAVLTVPSGYNVFIYDSEDWSQYGRYYYLVGYSPSWKVSPRNGAGNTKLPDAKFEVAGLLKISGALYTTSQGANICSTRENAGKVLFDADPASSRTNTSTTTSKNGLKDNFCQITASSGSALDCKVTYTAKPINSAWLKNEEGGYTFTSEASVGDIYAYMEDPLDGVYRWISVVDNGCFTEYKGSSTKQYIHPSDFVAVEPNKNGDHAYHNEGSTRMFINAKAATSDASCVWWEVDPTPEEIDGTTYYVANNENFDNFGTYYYWDTSYWKPKKITVTWQNEDGTKITNGTYGDEYNFNTSPQFFGTNPQKTPTTIEKYDWIGWRDAEGNIYDKNATLPRATSDVTYTAYFNTTKYQYTITFKNDDNSDLWAGLVDAGTTGAELKALFETKYNEKTGNTVPQKAPTVNQVFTFTGWNNPLATVEAAATYVAQYSESLRQYHVTFYNYDAVSVLYEADVDYNTSPAYGGVTPFRANTSAYSYDWTGWKQGATTYGTSVALPVMKGDISYIATFDTTALKYQVLFKRQDGSIIDAPFFSYEEKPDAFPANPTLASTVSTDYTFREWSPATLEPVTEDGKVYTALFDESPRQYTAHFVNYNGVSLNKDQTIDYNKVPEYTGATPFKPNDARNSYVFSGWAWAAGDGWEAGSIAAGEAFPAIKGNITFTAQFTPTLLQLDAGFYLDIVDVDNSEKTLKLNVSGTEWVTAGWPYEVNGTVYYRDQAKATAAGSDKYRATDRTLTIPYTDEPGENFTVTIRNASSTLVSKHTYIIPQEIKSATTLTTDQTAPIFVKGATMTVNADIEATNIYVGHDAKLVINSGVTLTADSLFLRTKPESAAELVINESGAVAGTTKVVYTRIILSKSGYFQFGLPLSCPISAVRLSNGKTVGYKSGTGWILRYYDEDKRATTGPGDNWATLDAAASIAAGRGYEMYSGVDYYREFYFPVDLSQMTNTIYVDYTAGEQPTNNGWNVLVSPLTHTFTNTPQPEGMKISWMQLDGSFLQEPLTTVAPAMTFAYQAVKEGSLVFDGSNVTVPTLAPRRVAAVEEATRIQWMHLDIKDANGLGDQTSIYSHPTRYDQTFKMGVDEEKQSLSASRALLYSSHAYGEMAFAGVADELLEQGVALTVYSPKTQELTISMRENEWLDRMAFVWLIDKATGAQIDLLESDYSFSAEAGTTAGRFILMGAFFAPQITTDNGTVQGDEDIKAKKFIYKDKMYIQINGVIYDATGKLVK